MMSKRGENSEAKNSSLASKLTSSKNLEWFWEDSTEFGIRKNILLGKENAHICDEFIGANEADESSAVVTFNSCEGDSEGDLSGLASALRVSMLRLSHDTPIIPDHLSSEAKSFVMSCLQRDPSNRPTAAQLIDHPFVCDQAARKSAIF